MTQRLLRALQRGGCTIDLGDDRWGVWRGQDRRGRVIGTLAGADIEVLRLRKEIAPLAGQDQFVFVWTGPQAKRETVTINADVLRDEARAPSPQILLERILRNVPCPNMRRWLSQAAVDYREDVELASLSGASPGMNWRSLQTGTRIEGGKRSSEFARTHNSSDAQLRVKALASLFDQDELSFLNQMVICEAKRASFTKRLGLRPKLVEQQGLALLRRLAEAYDCALKRQERVVRQSV